VARSVAASLLLAILLSIAVPATVLHAAGFDREDVDQVISEALDLLKRVQKLSSKGLNVTALVSELDDVVELAQSGEVRLAEAKLSSLRERVVELESIADRIYLASTILKYVKIAGVLSIPIIFYLLFPRLYLYLWFRARRRWIVRESTR